jgi:hypothetical protein
MSQPFLITADEINCLIYSYFKDSGECLAFALPPESIIFCQASFIQPSPCARRHSSNSHLIGKDTLLVESCRSSFVRHCFTLKQRHIGRTTSLAHLASRCLSPMSALQGQNPMQTPQLQPLRRIVMLRHLRPTGRMTMQNERLAHPPLNKHA